MRQKLAAQMKRDLMKGKQDYGLPLSSTDGPMDFLQFVGAMQNSEEESQQVTTYFF